ncbi:MAG: K+/H+ antiporter subunit F [Xanthomonadaceae bacterium]|nr:K+/H+ antiporter subunit F [Xanthomonadaceae bacterium]
MVMLGVALVLNVFRLLRGPTVADRILSLDTLYINTVAMLILFGMRLNTAIYFEAALVIAMLGFVGTVALCKYVMRRDIIE